jgi:hypothetical protein
MHNFAGTRELLWQRIALWGQWVRINTPGHPDDKEMDVNI